MITFYKQPLLSCLKNAIAKTQASYIRQNELTKTIMQSNLLWTGREYYSLENCVVDTTDRGSQIDSTIVGQYDGKIRTSQNWETLFLEVISQHSNQRDHLLFESDGKGNWIRDGQAVGQFNGCIDVDIPLTPFTNTLPINRLKLSGGEAQEIKVIYLDLLEQKIIPVKQKYIRLSNTEYHYENVPNDFEAKIEVDDLGLVVDYPLLFVRTAKLTTNYL